MDISRLPAPAFLKIFGYLPLKDRIRAGGVNKMFRQISQLAVSGTKSLDLSDDQFRKITPDQLAVILRLCASNLEGIKFGKGYHYLLATTFADFECPRLIDMNLGETYIDYDVFEQLIRNCPNMESFEWRCQEFVGFPPITSNNLKKLCLHVNDDAILRTMIDRCPNLEELNLLEYIGYDFVRGSISAQVLDQVLASTPLVHRIDVPVNVESVSTTEFVTKLVNFWNLPLIYLRFRFDHDFLGDDFLRKVAKSFPHLQELRLSHLKPTNQGSIASLAALQELQVLKLTLFIYGELMDEDDDDEPIEYDEGFCHLAAHCEKLRQLIVIRSNMTGGTLVNLLRSSSRLERVEVQDITQVESPDAAAVILESLAGIAQREITIRFHCWPKENVESIWRGEAAKAAIKKLEEDDGLKIMIKIEEEEEEEEDDDDDFTMEDDY